MSIQGVVFDLDGTLVDSTEAIVSSCFHTFDTIGQPRPARERIIASIGWVLDRQFATMTDHDPEECTRIYRARYAEIACDQTEPLPGAANALASLADAGFKLGFATSKKRSFAELILGHLGFLDYFVARVGPDDVANPKPAPDPIHRAAEQLSLETSSVLYVGDLPLDHEAATAAGADCVCNDRVRDARRTRSRGRSTRIRRARGGRRARPCAQWQGITRFNFARRASAAGSPRCLRPAFGCGPWRR